MNIAEGISLHTIDEVEDYFQTKPHTAKNKDNILVTHDGRVFIRTMIMMPGVNRHGWGVDEQYIPYNIKTIKGTPLTFALQKKTSSAGTEITIPHPAIQNAPAHVNDGFQEAYTIGKYLDHEDKPDHNRVWHGLAEVTNGKAKEFYADLYWTKQEGTFPTTVSPQILHYDNEDRFRIKRWWFQHVTVTDDPAYPREFAQITGSCSGDESQCIPQLRQSGPSAEILVPQYRIVDASQCPICVKDALMELTKPNPENSSLIAKSASFDQSMNENNSGNTNTAGLDANNQTNASGTNSQQTGALSTAQTQESKPTILPPVSSPQGGYSASEEVKNLPQQIEEIIKKSIAEYLGQNQALKKDEAVETEKPVSTTKKQPKKFSSEKEPSEEEDVKKPEDTGEEKDKPLTAREKLLLERITQQDKAIHSLNESERKRGIQMALASVNEGKQFIDPKTKQFDDKKFQEQVNYWMNNTTLDGDGVEKQLKTMIDLVGPIVSTKETIPEKTEPAVNRAYGGSSMATIYGVGELDANNSNVETKNASMSGVESPQIGVPYFIQLERRTVLRSDPIGQVE